MYTFIYKFIFRYQEKKKFHFTFDHTDSIYMDMSADPTRNSSQSYDVIVKNQTLYDKWIKLSFIILKI